MLTLGYPLIGVSPLIAAANTILGAQGIQQHAATFFANMARPSGYLTTAGKFPDRQKAEELKKRWNDAYSGASNAGKVPVLEYGMEYKQLTMTAVDAQLVEQLRWTVEDIARVFQIPAFLIGDMTRMMARTSESLMRIYAASCLMAHFSSITERVNLFYELDPTKEFIDFDIDELFRTDFDVRVQSWTKATQGGIATPNEARKACFGFNPVEGGDECFMQQQMIPLTSLGQVAAGGLPGLPASETPPTPDDIAAAFDLELQRRLARWAA
jgi:HK97 family phage portal protein